ncbi:polycomb group protein Psc-like isoform X2 [Euwallacea fornicatus]|uniref:polycomb group protein Psc-like isoform X2 n=1 Tax=Euwallacea fornicatus TaxID=995702 RepID=UPI00338DAC98
MDKHSPKTMMHKDTAAKRSLSKLNSCITCKLCKGYFVDATTIIECLHTFCRSCIVKYLESNKYCPICDVQVHKTKPLLNIRQDKTIQDLVYKVVPRLYHNESKRRKLFYESNPSTKPSICEENVAALYEFILTPEESINLTLNYYACTATPRYLRCSSAVSIAHLKKLISAKYDLTDRHRVDIFYKQEVLSPSWSLMDVAYIHSWKKMGTLDLTYKIYERWAKKPKLEGVDLEKENSTSNSNNWKEVQLRISENGEMSITGIQDALELLDATAKFKSEIVINESKILEDSTEKQSNPTVAEATEQNTCTKDPPVPISTIDTTTTNTPTITTTAIPKSVTIAESQSTAPLSSLFTITVNSAARTSVTSKPSSVLPRSIELSETLNLNSELSVIPLNVNANGVSRSSCGTTTVFSTINKSMCSTKSEESCNLGPPPKTPTDANKELPLNSILKQNNSLKRKMEESEKFASELPTKLPKPTILNHSIGIMSLSNNHPLKKHSSKMNRNGECRHIEIGDKVHNLTASLVTAAQKNITENSPSKPIIINRSPNYLNQLSKGVSLSKIQKNNNSGNVPCYMPKERNGDKEESHEKAELCISKPPSHQYQNSHHPPIITPSQLPHHQNLHIRGESTPQTTISMASSDAKSVESSLKATSQNVSDTSTSVKPKPSTPIGYKTLRDPPKSWNSQINSQIAKVNQNAKLANLAGAAAQGRLGGGLKNVRPPKFFKGRNMPRYLGNPASGVKPMYQVQISQDKDKGQETPKGKSEKSEIKKHSIVKIDPKTLRPISEKAPETTSLSNMQSGPHANAELRLNSSGSGDLKINISSVSIFNPLKLQQSSPKSERRSPKSPHSPKVRASANGGSTALISASTTITTSSSTPPLLNALSPKQQRDKISLTTPPNPYIPNLASPTLNPNQFLYPAGGFPSYDPRFMAACHNLWYTQRIAAAAAAGLVPPPLPHGFGLNIGLNPTGSIGQQPSNPGISPKHSSSTKLNNHTSSKANNNGQQNHQLQKAPKKTKEASTGVKNEKSLETALVKLSQSKAKEASVAKADTKRESNKSNTEEEKLPKSSGKTQKLSEKEVCENLTGDAQEESAEAVKDSSNESKSQETENKEPSPVGINDKSETVKILPTLDKEEKSKPLVEETPSEPAQEPPKPEEKDNTTGETAVEEIKESVVKCGDKTEPLESRIETENSVLLTSKNEKETELVSNINSDPKGDKVEERKEEASSDSVSACACDTDESTNVVETPKEPNKKGVEEVSPGDIVVQKEVQTTNGLAAETTEKVSEIQAETLGA